MIHDLLVNQHTEQLIPDVQPMTAIDVFINKLFGVVRGWKQFQELLEDLKSAISDAKEAAKSAGSEQTGMLAQAEDGFKWAFVKNETLYSAIKQCRQELRVWSDGNYNNIIPFNEIKRITHYVYEQLELFFQDIDKTVSTAAENLARELDEVK